LTVVERAEILNCSLCDFQLHEIEMEIQRKKDALKEDDRRRRNLARQVGAVLTCEALASPAMGHWGTCPLDFQVPNCLIFQITSELYKL